MDHSSLEPSFIFLFRKPNLGYLQMANIVSTEIVVVPTDSAYTLPGDWEPSAIVASYSANIPGLSSMQSSVTTETRANGTVKIVTFTNRTGTKG